MEEQLGTIQLEFGSYNILLRAKKCDNSLSVLTEVSSLLKVDEKIAEGFIILSALLVISRIYKDRSVGEKEIIKRVKATLKQIFSAEAEGKLNSEKMQLFK